MRATAGSFGWIGQRFRHQLRCVDTIIIEQKEPRQKLLPYRGFRLLSASDLADSAGRFSDFSAS